MNMVRYSRGLGAGRERRNVVAAPAGLLAHADGVADRQSWLVGYLDEHLDIGGDGSSNWFRSGSSLTGTVTALGEIAFDGRHLTRHVSATTAVGVNRTDGKDSLIDDWLASAPAGARFGI
jgi:hypothetical protein